MRKMGKNMSRYITQFYDICIYRFTFAQIKKIEMKKCLVTL